MLPALLFPPLNPIALELGPLVIRWYALSYIAGILLGWWIAKRMAGRVALSFGWTPKLLEDFVTWATLGIILGGRLGYVIFYKPSDYLANPAQIFRVWEGGMSFHGGALGVIFAVILFARVKKLPIMALGDIIAAVAPLGLGLGRIANFINAELYGRISDVPWAVVFPGQSLARHPSQLYQACLEGFALFAVQMLLEKRGLRQHSGLLVGCFLTGYGIARFIGEFFREPDSFLGFLFGNWLTMGQLLSLPMILAGLVVIRLARQGSFLPKP
jgi:phosphatidylglycerol:prolipoprotein diacylglycerol transferase